MWIASESGRKARGDMPSGSSWRNRGGIAVFAAAEGGAQKNAAFFQDKYCTALNAAYNNDL
ncbi:MAG: hypothetical protein P4L75_04940 [Clostridia bacterium]|nr:hypothetical protein [Clostridia bacterium]MDR3645120.1 hypothetical protein [Clostridia bacterium]